MRVRAWLLEEKSSLKINEVAKLLNVSRRTLSNWKNEKPRNKIGRPSYGKSIKFKALIKVGREWKKQGCPGWRPVRAALKNEIPTRLIQSKIKKLKLLRRKHERKRILSNRLSIKVKFKNVYWSQDGAEFKKRKYQIIKDRASLKLITVKAAKSDTSQTVIKNLERAKRTRRLPLVLSTDNGSNFISKPVEEYLKKNKVVHLRSLPRTPQHNGAVECAIREIKEAARLNACSLEEAAEIINKSRLRASFSFKTSVEMDDKMGEGYSELKRNAFYDHCVRALKKSCAETTNSRSKRMIERKVIHEMLEKFNLIEINRGGLV